ncbi:ScyD/ScyE family protein [Nocardioides campestrisoli]|uniref:ScyD/ScyE family protein n=1 Tax=Nocardioides campestrisoli TaxID=2736757 RepID=UPI00163DE04A|nr:ScyD/ScyE family protein [Nocardioides campestrisoli]
MRSSTKIAALAASLTLITAPTLTGSALAAGPSGPPHPPDTPGVSGSPTVTEVATGLDNPRLLSRTGGSLYVAEAGVGGTGPCIEGGEGRACYGPTGAVTRIDRSGQRRVLTGLPSLAGEDGSAATGPSDVAAVGGQYLLSLGLGADPVLRSDLGPAGRLLGVLATGTFRTHGPRGPAFRSRDGQRGHHGHPGRTRGPDVLADLARYEALQDPDQDGPDSNPTGFALTRDGVVVTDSGGNTLLLVRPGARTRTLAVFPERLFPAPEGFPQIPGVPEGQIPSDAVPTSVVQGPDGALYVSQLTGFPFPAGGSTIWRVVPGMPPTQYATGLTNVTDLAWHRGSLYAVQLSDVGLAAEPGLPTGSLRRIDRDGGQTAVASGLPAPYGVALDRGSAYVTTCAVCPDAGSVVRIDLLPDGRTT